MDSLSPRTGLALLVLAHLLGLVLAQCEDFPCGNYGFFSGSTCGVDPNDGSLLGIPINLCPCEPATHVLSVTYTGVNKAVTTETSSVYLPFSYSQTTLTYSFTGTNTDIRSGSPVSVNIKGFSSFTYVYSPVTSIHYVKATVTSTAKKAPATITPTETSTVTKTVHSSCIQPTTKRSQQPGNLVEPALQALRHPVNVGKVENDWCSFYQGSPVNTTYTTATTTRTVTKTGGSTVTLSQSTSTAHAVRTITKTVYPNAHPSACPEPEL